MLILCAGCSGINASGSVSPATFFLPGVSAEPLDSTPGGVGEAMDADLAAEFASLN